MISDLQKLIELQQVDREIQRLQEEVAALPRRVGEIEAKLADTKAQVDKARATIKADETTRRKLESQIQDQQLRISGRNKDDLQAVIKAVKDRDFDIPLQFTNYRP